MIAIREAEAPPHARVVCVQCTVQPTWQCLAHVDAVEHGDEVADVNVNVIVVAVAPEEGRVALKLSGRLDAAGGGDQRAERRRHMWLPCPRLRRW
jgi:hypothetical protein